MDDITSHLASCHLSKCSKCSKDNENELILARVRIRGLVGIRNWNDNLPKAQTLNSLCTDPSPLPLGKIGEGAPSPRGWGWCVHRLTLKWQSAQGTDTYLAGFCERQGLVRLDCKPLCWKMSPQGIGRRRKSSLRSCQYPGHTLDHTGKITSVAGRHVVNLQIASEISQSFAPSCKYHSFLSHAKNF